LLGYVAYKNIYIEEKRIEINVNIFFWQDIAKQQTKDTNS